MSPACSREPIGVPRLRLVILDRDGVINRDSDAFIKSPREWVPLPGSIDAIARLHRADWRVVVATNQSGLARKLFDRATLDHIHARMHQQVRSAGGRISGIYLCPHGPDDDCTCRKPRSGLFRRIARDMATSLDGVWAIGDARRDLQAAATAGAQPVLVRTGKGKRTLCEIEALRGVLVFEDLRAVATGLLESHR